MSTTRPRSSSSINVATLIVTHSLTTELTVTDFKSSAWLTVTDSRTTGLTVTQTSTTGLTVTDSLVAPLIMTITDDKTTRLTVVHGPTTQLIVTDSLATPLVMTDLIAA